MPFKFTWYKGIDHGKKNRLEIIFTNYNLNMSYDESNFIIDYLCVNQLCIHIHCGSSLRNSQTGSFRKPVLAGLRSNNEMNFA